MEDIVWKIFNKITMNRKMNINRNINLLFL